MVEMISTIREGFLEEGDIRSKLELDELLVGGHEGLGQGEEVALGGGVSNVPPKALSTSLLQPTGSTGTGVPEGNRLPCRSAAGARIRAGCCRMLVVTGRWNGLLVQSLLSSPQESTGQDSLQDNGVSTLLCRVPALSARVPRDWSPPLSSL